MTKRKSPKAPYTRTRDGSFVRGFVRTAFNRAIPKNGGATVVYTNSQTTTLVKNTRSMTDVVTPGFEKLRASGRIVNSPMTQVLTDYQCSSNSYSAWNHHPSWPDDQYYDESGVVPCILGTVTPAAHSVNIPNLKNYVSVKALAGMKPSTMQGFVALAEGGKTFRMLLHPLSSAASLLKYVTQLRQARKNISISNSLNSITINGRVFPRHQQRWRGPGRIVKPPLGTIVLPIGTAVSGTVLANNLGLRPLMMDLNALLNEIPKLHNAERLTSRATLSDTSETSDASVLSFSIFSFPMTTVTKTTVTCRASVLYEDKFDVPSDFGVSPWDIPLAGWELIPYSFVVDYFVNVGDMLAAFQMQNTRKIISSSLVTTIDTVATRTFNGTTSSVSTFDITKPLSGSDVLTRTEKFRQDHLETITPAYRPLTKVFRPTVVQNLLSLVVIQLAGLGKTNRHSFY